MKTAIALLSLAACAAEPNLSASTRAVTAPAWLDYMGPACPPERTRVAVSPDGAAATLLFGSFWAPPLTACALALELGSGHAAAVAVRGFTSLGSRLEIAASSACWTWRASHSGADDEVTIGMLVPACGLVEIVAVVVADPDELSVVDSIDIDTEPVTAP